NVRFRRWFGPTPITLLCKIISFGIIDQDASRGYAGHAPEQATGANRVPERYKRSPGRRIRTGIPCLRIAGELQSPASLADVQRFVAEKVGNHDELSFSLAPEHGSERSILFRQ